VIGLYDIDTSASPLGQRRPHYDEETESPVFSLTSNLDSTGRGQKKSFVAWYLTTSSTSADTHQSFQYVVWLAPRLARSLNGRGLEIPTVQAQALCLKPDDSDHKNWPRPVR